MSVSASVFASTITTTFPASNPSSSAKARRVPAAGPAKRSKAKQYPEWISGVSLSLALHVALAIVLWLQQRALPPMPAQPAAEAVLMELSLIPEAPRSNPRDLPPGPVQPDRLASHSRSQPAPIEPTADIAPRETGDKHVVPQTPADRPTDTSASIDASASQASAPPEAPSTDASRHAAAQDTAGSLPAPTAQWQNLLLGHLQRYKRYPRQARRLRQEGVSYVYLVVDRSGNVLSWRTERSSGHSVLDEEALAVVQRASPVPAPPADTAGDTVQVLVPIEFHISSD